MVKAMRLTPNELAVPIYLTLWPFLTLMSWKLYFIGLYFSFSIIREREKGFPLKVNQREDDACGRGAK